MIYTSAFIAEIVRAGIQSVGRGQREAARALGLSGVDTLRHVTFPQALRVIIPPLISQFLNLTKNSSLGGAVGYTDMTNVAITMTQTAPAVSIFLLIMLAYLAMSLSWSLVGNIYNPAHPDHGEFKWRNHVETTSRSRAAAASDERRRRGLGPRQPVQRVVRQPADGPGLRRAGRGPVVRPRLGAPGRRLEHRVDDRRALRDRQLQQRSGVPGNDCFWRPQAALLLVTLLLGLGWGATREGTMRVIAVLVAGRGGGVRPAAVRHGPDGDGRAPAAAGESPRRGSRMDAWAPYAAGRRALGSRSWACPSSC